MDTTSGDARFDRYYRRIQLGLRLLSHGARAQTACDWSGLTPDRLITLKRRWLPDAAYEIFREWEPSADMEFDQAALLARGAASSEDIELFRCLHCQSAMLIDKWARRREVCSGCRGRRSASP